MPQDTASTQNVYVLIEDEADNRTVILGVYTTADRARTERKRIYTERGTDRLVADHAAYLRQEDPAIYAFMHGKQTPERIARYRYERIRIQRVALNAAAETE